MLRLLRCYRPFRNVQFGIFLLFIFASISGAQGLSDDVSNLRSATFGESHPLQIQMEGRVTIYRGSTTEDGSVLLLADSQGTSRSRFGLPSGDIVEEQWEDGHRRCRTSSSSGIDERLTPDCWRAAPWFFPQMALLHNKNLTKFAQERRVEAKGASYARVTSLRTEMPLFKGKNQPPGADRWSESQVFVDLKTGLPSKHVYAVHSEQRPMSPLTVEITLDDYASESGVQVPHHIQKFINGNLQADIHIKSVTIK